MLDRLRDAARAVADLPSTRLQADPAAGRSASWTTARGAGAPSRPGGTPSCSIPPSPVSNSDVGAGGRRSQAMQRAGAVAPRVRADRRGQKTIELFRAGFTRFRLSRFGIRFSPKCLHLPRAQPFLPGWDRFPGGGDGPGLGASGWAVAWRFVRWMFFPSPRNPVDLAGSYISASGSQEHW